MKRLDEIIRHIEYGLSVGRWLVVSLRSFPKKEPGEKQSDLDPNGQA